MQWTSKKIMGLIILLALVIAALFFGTEGLDAVGSALKTFVGLGGVELVE